MDRFTGARDFDLATVRIMDSKFALDDEVIPILIERRGIRFRQAEVASGLQPERKHANARIATIEYIDDLAAGIAAPERSLGRRIGHQLGAIEQRHRRRSLGRLGFFHEGRLLLVSDTRAIRSAHGFVYARSIPVTARFTGPCHGRKTPCASSFSRQSRVDRRR